MIPSIRRIDRLHGLRQAPLRQVGAGACARPARTDPRFPLLATEAHRRGVSPATAIEAGVAATERHVRGGGHLHVLANVPREDVLAQQLRVDGLLLRRRPPPANPAPPSARRGGGGGNARSCWVKEPFPAGLASGGRRPGLGRENKAAGRDNPAAGRGGAGRGRGGAPDGVGDVEAAVEGALEGPEDAGPGRRRLQPHVQAHLRAAATSRHHVPPQSRKAISDKAVSDPDGPPPFDFRARRDVRAVARASSWKCAAVGDAVRAGLGDCVE